MVVKMNKNFLLGMLVAIPLFFGCRAAPAPYAPPSIPYSPPETIFIQTPPETLMPLTVGILQRLFETEEQMLAEINKYQLVIFGRVFLERNYIQSSTRLESGGMATFENQHIRDEITIQDQTEGQAMKTEIIDNEIVFSVCFEREDRYVSSQLQFTSMLWDTDAYFYLKYSPNARNTNLSDERGVLQYGGPEYKLKFTSERSPYLLIKLSQRDIERVNARTASGRKVS